MAPDLNRSRSVSCRSLPKFGGSHIRPGAPRGSAHRRSVTWRSRSGGHPQDVPLASEACASCIRTSPSEASRGSHCHAAPTGSCERSNRGTCRLGLGNAEQLTDSVNRDVLRILLGSICRRGVIEPGNQLAAKLTKIVFHRGDLLWAERRQQQSTMIVMVRRVRGDRWCWFAIRIGSCDRNPNRREMFGVMSNLRHGLHRHGHVCSSVPLGRRDRALFANLVPDVDRVRSPTLV